MLSTKNRCQEFKECPIDGRVMKMMPRYDGPWEIVSTCPETSTYILNLPTTTNIFPTFHSLQIKPFIHNDDNKFPLHKNVNIPAPILVNGKLENYVNHILDFKKINKRPSDLIHWVGFRPEHDKWLLAADLEDNKALDHWIDFRGLSHLSSNST